MHREMFESSEGSTENELRLGVLCSLVVSVHTASFSGVSLWAWQLLWGSRAQAAAKYLNPHCG